MITKPKKLVKRRERGGGWQGRGGGDESSEEEEWHPWMDDQPRRSLRKRGEGVCAHALHAAPVDDRKQD